MILTCIHGFWLTQCAICSKRAGECDFGSCTQPSVGVLEYVRPDGTVAELRAMCERHGDFAICLQGRRGEAFYDLTARWQPPMVALG